MKSWIEAVKDELGIDLDVDTAELLDMTRVVAHGVARPAAPLTAFLVGYAAAGAAAARAAAGTGTGIGNGPAASATEAVTEANRAVCELAERWVAERRDEAGTP